ncbi:SMP-30/gluconolactonase/LRE family protein [Aurantiacibacter gilvus]|uniref:SMP-30/Gluconolactonase/LRE-like region domain-containing protein n=1 Tax=Aurantiacibacter gilvus TaxID=3139141 RepID=A0ABU9I9K9_9SPHN
MMGNVWSVLGMTLAMTACATLPESTDAPAEILMQGERLHPESITSDARGTLYIGSNPGTVFRAFAGDPVAVPWIVPDETNGLQTVFGVLVDQPRGLLWVCSNAMGGEGETAIKSFSLYTGDLATSYPLAVEGPAMCNDMTVAPNGDVYASETTGGRILVLRNGGRQFEHWATDPEFASLDGISFGPGGELYANAIQRNTLLRVHRNADGSFARAEVLETSAPLSGPDGLRPLDDTRMLQSEGNAGTITVLTFAEGQPVQVEVIAEGIDYASSVTMVGDHAWYPEGKLRFMFGPDAGEDPGPFVVRSAPIPPAD